MEQKKQEEQQAQEAQKVSALQRLLQSIESEQGEEAEQAKAIILDGVMKIRGFLLSDEVKQLRESFKGFKEWVAGTKPQRDFSGLYVWAQIFEQMRPAWPYFMEELEKDPAYKEMTFEDFMRNVGEDGQPIESEFEKVLKRAQERLQSKETGNILQEVFPRIQKTLPASHVIPITTLATELQNGGIINAGEMNLPVNIGKPNGMTNYVNVSLELPEGVNIKAKSYTAFDREVDNAVYSLFMFGDDSKVFTPAMVYRKMAGRAGTPPGRKMLTRIEETLDRHRKIDVEIDATEEVRAYMKRKHIDPDEQPVKAYWGDRLLPLSFAVIENGKDKIKGYRFTSEPPVLAHAKTVGKLTTIKTALLDIKDENGASLSNNEQRIAIKGYLLRRIQQMKRDEKKKEPQLSRKILLKTMFADAGIEKTDAKTDLTKYAIAALENWKREGFIVGFSQQKSGRRIDAFIIDLAEEEQQAQL